MLFGRRLLPLDFSSDSARPLANRELLLMDLLFLELRQFEWQRWPIGRPGKAVGGAPMSEVSDRELGGSH